MTRRPTIPGVHPVHGGRFPALRREERLAQPVREAEAEEWLAANRKAIDAYNARVEREGVWSDKLRGF